MGWRGDIRLREMEEGVAVTFQSMMGRTQGQGEAVEEEGKREEWGTEER